jgi:hypothetical protein
MKLNRSTVFDCSIIDISKIHNKAGSITVIENDENAPFTVKRIYYLYDIPAGEIRGGHAHYELEQYIIAASGSFDVVLDDGKNKRVVNLNRPYLALHVVSGLWRELNNFSSGSISLVLASEKYMEEDYVRNYEEFLNFKK